MPTADDYPDIRPVRDAEVSLLPWAKGPVWELRKPWSFTVNYGGKSWSYTIPAGFMFDGQSVPSIFHGFPLEYGPAGVGMRAGLEHDLLCWLYEGGSPWLLEQYGGKLPEPPPIAAIHDHYRRVQLEDGQRPRKAWATWLAVVLFGPGGKARPSTWLAKLRGK